MKINIYFKVCHNITYLNCEITVVKWNRNTQKLTGQLIIINAPEGGGGSVEYVRIQLEKVHLVK